MNSRIARNIVTAFWGILSVFLSACASTSPFQDKADRAMTSWAGRQNGSAVIYTVSELPLNVRNYFGEIADRNGRFNPGCVWREGVPGKRFLVAARNENTWRVAAEAGGFVYHWDVTEFTLSPSGDILETKEIPHSLTNSLSSRMP